MYEVIRVLPLKSGSDTIREFFSWSPILLSTLYLRRWSPYSSCVTFALHSTTIHEPVHENPISASHHQKSSSKCASLSSLALLLTSTISSAAFAAPALDGHANTTPELVSRDYSSENLDVPGNTAPEVYERRDTFAHNDDSPSVQLFRRASRHGGQSSGMQGWPSGPSRQSNNAHSSSSQWAQAQGGSSVPDNLPKYYTLPNPDSDILIDDMGFPHPRGDAKRYPHIPVYGSSSQNAPPNAMPQQHSSSRPSNSASFGQQQQWASHSNVHSSSSHPPPTSHGFQGASFAPVQPQRSSHSNRQPVMQPAHQGQRQPTFAAAPPMFGPDPATLQPTSGRVVPVLVPPVPQDKGKSKSKGNTVILDAQVIYNTNASAAACLLDRGVLRLTFIDCFVWPHDVPEPAIAATSIYGLLRYVVFGLYQTVLDLPAFGGCIRNVRSIARVVEALQLVSSALHLVKVLVGFCLLTAFLHVAFVSAQAPILTMRFSALLAFAITSVGYSRAFATPIWNANVEISRTNALHPSPDLAPRAYYSVEARDVSDDHLHRYNLNALEMRDNSDAGEAIYAEPSKSGLFKRNLPHFYYFPNGDPSSSILIDEMGFPHPRTDAQRYPHIPLYITEAEAEAHLRIRPPQQGSSRPPNNPPPSNQWAQTSRPDARASTSQSRPPPTAHGGGFGYAPPQQGGGLVVPNHYVNGNSSKRKSDKGKGISRLKFWQ
ncbi:hypothetical protein K474DRAFT_1678286 [Panus rudis PR-1116 ss-1]|nr:hypothetical protein K474DRAFT_1678286 [Panus rudis PR-1116 ss-1]